jgi:ectoine hydroxylase-related dioxygenase (phytanoyl-CoA dioxygenase family)
MSNDEGRKSKAMDLRANGCEVVRGRIEETTLEGLKQGVFAADRAGTRCLLDDALVRKVAAEVRESLVADGFLTQQAVAIQAIAFDKAPGTNWKVTWHQDVMFPFTARVTTPGFDLPSRKGGIDYARPPREILEDLLAVRLHLDDCGQTNGPLRVSPGSHGHGILRSTEIPGCLDRCGETTCLAQAGDVLLMKPLLLHASSPATEPSHRRVLHLVYHSGQSIAERWHRAV